jgi:hypothetical protein
MSTAKRQQHDDLNREVAIRELLDVSFKLVEHRALPFPEDDAGLEVYLHALLAIQRELCDSARRLIHADDLWREEHSLPSHSSTN